MDENTNGIMIVDEVATLEGLAVLPVQTAKELIIQTNENIERAKELVSALKDLQRKIHEIYDPLVESANKTHKKAVAERKKHLEPLEMAEVMVRGRMNSFMTSQDVIRKQAEEERRKLEEAHQARLTQDSPPSIESIPRKLSVERLAPRDLPEVPEIPKIEGLSQVKDWKWKIVDVSLIPAEFWMLDEKAIEAVVKVQKESTQIPGIEVFYTIRGRQT